MCILTGRLNPLNDGFTSVSTKGSAVVDYIAMSHNNFNNCNSFYVDSCTDTVSKNNLQSSIGDKCKVSDHSLLSTVINLCVSLNNVLKDINANSIINCPIANQYTNQKYHFKLISDSFTQTDDVLLSLDKVMDDIIKTKGIQEELDLLYENLCSLIYTKIQRKIPCVSDSKKIRKYQKPSKPF